MLDMHAHNRVVAPGGITALGTPLDLSEVAYDSFIVAGMTDHLTPWKAFYMTSQLVASPSEIVVPSTGDIQTIVSSRGNLRGR
jgi:poly[(R)-3-hydroxyalkanoate] polymerase subunit PhaC